MDILAENRKAGFSFEILEKFQGGLALQGSEVKSARLGRMQIAGTYVVIKNGELWLVGSNIPPYQPKNTPSNFQAERSRKVLVQRRELNSLVGKTAERGLTLIPLKVYSTPAGKIKLEFALARHQKKWDKREKLKKEEVNREIQQALHKQTY
ncbi:MAG: SsrA-binding protein SmpB [Candidatus Wildermuthbacteria bacterium]|nr:SsrA-binding protein SmpB [Candidatus Wildermuthbacteria bacterium]